MIFHIDVFEHLAFYFIDARFCVCEYGLEYYLQQPLHYANRLSHFFLVVVNRNYSFVSILPFLAPIFINLDFLRVVPLVICQVMYKRARSYVLHTLCSLINVAV